MSNNLHFDTLQLHAGQQIDRQQSQERFLFIKPLPMLLTMPPMQPTFLD